MDLSIITPTGYRPKCFELCKHWMYHQNWNKKIITQWLIVDDELASRVEVIGDSVGALLYVGDDLMPATMYWGSWEPGENTQQRNLITLLKKATGDVIAIVEDDDWYAPTYLQTMYNKIQEGFDIVGEAQGFYYHFPKKKFHRHGNKKHAGLCQTVFRKELIPLFLKILEKKHTYYDMELWKQLKPEHRRFLFPRAQLVVGMKGLPGRPGIGRGHDDRSGPWNQDDKNYTKLKKMIGAEDVEIYRRTFA